MDFLQVPEFVSKNSIGVLQIHPKNKSWDDNRNSCCVIQPSFFRAENLARNFMHRKSLVGDIAFRSIAHLIHVEIALTGICGNWVGAEDFGCREAD